ncbi:rhomboid family intramembrane serine protease [Bradyrhizobium sp. HKCCYLS20291]|uniref:rhomboid family intramembrane serine protease n=1 Tax=Bradyrhizobium sp. HKCCYLS20291 TaxID=3420766 RepID=UPI003EB6D934
MHRIEPTFGEPPARVALPSHGSPPPPSTQDTSTQDTSTQDTFCRYLAKQFIAKQGFDLTHIPEAARLYDICDVVLARSDGFSFSLLCMVDREARPDATFKMSLDEFESIGEACLQYSGSVNGRKMPVMIAVMEVGPGYPGQLDRLERLKRSSLFAKVHPSAMAIDTEAGEVTFSNGGGLLSNGLYRGFVDKVLAAPRENDADLQRHAVVVADSSFPWLTLAILAVLAAAFAAEIQFGIGPWTGLLQPSITTLVALGALSPTLVLQEGEWYRLLTAPFLHADLVHLVMNGIALFLAGRSLEALIGRAWFAATYAMAGLCGSLLSLALNSNALVSVGASGAIMGLFAAMLVVSVHFPPGPIRTALQMNAVYVLVPSLLPLAGLLKGERVDYAAHFGGAIGGAIIGVALLRIWSNDEAWPRFRRAAAVLAVVSLIALVYPLLAIPRAYQAMAFTAELIPPDRMPRSQADMSARLSQLIAEYPRDPRPRLVRSGKLLDAGDLEGAERDARAGLADEPLWHALLSPELDSNLHGFLALAISQKNPAEARTVAQSACAAIKDGQIRKALDQRSLCKP